MHDLIIAGAGPAGSAAAREAASLGLDTLVLEKDAFPRYKPCGGALSDRALSLLDFRLPEGLCERAITGARVHFQGKVMERHKGYRLTTLVTRSSFDHFLLQKAKDAGAMVATQKAIDYQEADDHVKVFTKDGSYQSRFLVISSGCQDGLRNRILGPEARARLGVCMVTEIEEDDQKIEERLQSCLDIHFGVADMGYGWIFPHKGYYSVGIGGLASRLKNPRGTMQEFLKRSGFSGRYRLHGHTIPFGDGMRKVSEGRVLLAGDSAGFVDAFTGEGIYYALRSGQLAARVIVNESVKEVAHAYQHTCRKDFGEELRYAWMFSKLMHSRPEIFMRILTCRNEVLDRYIEIAAAKNSYKDFLRWLVPRLPWTILRTI